MCCLHAGPESLGPGTRRMAQCVRIRRGGRLQRPVYSRPCDDALLRSSAALLGPKAVRGAARARWPMITVLGSQGFVGRHVVQELEQRGLPYFAPPREAPLSGTPLGDVIYCIGLTADFRSRPFETVEAHVVKLRDVLEGCDLDSLLYLSSTRVY